MMEDIFRKHRCDKGSKHRYELIYEKDFEKLKNLPINLLEIGIAGGKSIMAWLDYFSHATIYAIDIFPPNRPQPADIPVLNHPRVNWQLCNSATKDAKELWKDIKFDIIIDDGAHFTPYNRLTFINFFDKLKKGGIYYVEDVLQFNIITAADRLSYAEVQSTDYYKRAGSIEEYNVMIETFRKKGKRLTIYDNREISNNIDSCIIKIEK